MALQLGVQAAFTEDQNVATPAPGDGMPLFLGFKLIHGFSRMPK